MKLVSAKINNYKSFKSENNIIKFDNYITTIIGKNESGKSNLIDLLASISLTSGINKNVFECLNRNAPDQEVAISLNFELDVSEKDILKSTNSLCRFSFLKPNEVLIEGAISEFFQDSEEFIDLNSFFEELYNDKLISLDNNILKVYKTYIDELKKAPEKIVDYIGILKTISNWINAVQDTKIKEKSIRMAKRMNNLFEMVYGIFPRFYKYSGLSLKNEYQIGPGYFDDPKIQDETIMRFFKACKISNDLAKEFNNTDRGKAQDIQDKMKSCVKENIEQGFQKFYTQDEIKVKLNFTHNQMSILINSDNTSMQISERSNGLRWYFNLFVDLNASDLENKKVIFLIDEPGVYLHVEAQKELLELFIDLTKDGNQLIYATHSPYMLDEDNISRVKALQKNDGYTQIFNNIYDARLSSESKLETLSPLLSALGLKLSHNIGPKLDCINIITEGITESFYLKAMAMQLGYNKLYFISAVGCSNIAPVATILFGWGHKFKIIFDHDSAGNQEAEKIIKHFGEEFNDLIIYVNSEKAYKRELNFTVENLIDKADYEILGMTYLVDKLINKKLLAKNFYDRVAIDRIALSKATNENFIKLFEFLTL